MPFQSMNLQEASDYLHLPKQDVEQLVKRGKIPFRVVAGNFIFNKRQLHDWATQNILSSNESSLENYHGKVAQSKNVPDINTAFLHKRISINTINSNLQAKTRNSLLKGLVGIAQKTNLVCDKEELFKLLSEREELCPTGLTNGVAIPHTRTHPDYLFLDTFLIIVKVPGGIPFGSIDGKLSDIFFLPCAQNDRSHLYILARLAMMIQKVSLGEKLREVDTDEDILKCFSELEKLFVKNYIEKK